MSNHPNRSTSHPASMFASWEVWFCNAAGTPVRNNRSRGSHVLSGARWVTEEHANAAIADAYDNYDRKQAKRRGEIQGPYATRCQTLGVPGTEMAPRGRLKAVKVK